MERLQAQGAAVDLTIIGDGPARATLQSLANRLGVASRITWHPWLPHEEIQSKLQEHDVFVFPSLRDSGGMAVLEALAHGLPVVCTDLGGPANTVNSRCGRVIPTKDRSADMIAEDLALHLNELATNPGLRKSLSIAARRRAWMFEFRRLVEAIYSAPSNPDALSQDVPA
jgi:glycosyltransferase involved in cell wall biosynthesis